MCQKNGKCGGGCTVHKVSKYLVIIGAINLGLVGLGMLMGQDLNIIGMIFASWSTGAAIVYLLIGVAGVEKLFHCRCKKCMEVCAACETGDMDKKM